MFSRKEQVIKKTGPKGVGRYQFLSLLVQEFEKSNTNDARRQVLANLANFCYDPINFEFIRRLNVIEIFLRQLSGGNEEFIHFSLAGLCNLSSDPQNAEYIVKQNGVFLISQYLLFNQNIEISLNALCTLIFLIGEETQASITTPDIINKVLHYQASPDPRLQNLGNIFLEDYCSKEQIEYAKISTNLEIPDIPLPSRICYGAN